MPFHVRLVRPLVPRFERMRAAKSFSAQWVLSGESSA